MRGLMHRRSTSIHSRSSDRRSHLSESIRSSHGDLSVLAGTTNRTKAQTGWSLQIQLAKPRVTHGLQETTLSISPTRRELESKSGSLRTIFERAANRSPFARSRSDDLAIEPGNAVASNPGFWRRVLLDHRVYRQNGV